jgi:four helix bundle protein
MSYHSFENLEVWQKACQLAVRTYEILEGCRDYGLKDQMTRAAVSVASNIAEGAERDSKTEFAKFLHIAKGSAAELRTQIYIACSINVINDQTQKEIVGELLAISGMLHSLIKVLKK